MAADPETPSGISENIDTACALTAPRVPTDRIKENKAKYKLRFIQSGLRQSAKINSLFR
jgi:hypothetical protein